MKNAKHLVKEFLAVFMIFTIIPSLVAAQDADQSDKEVKQMIQKQFERMYEKGIENLSERIVLTGGVKPFAVVSDTGDNVKAIRIRQAEEMPPEMALAVLRRSLIALVKKGKIGATAIFYTADNPNKESNAEKVLVVEMEHIFGPTLAQLVPFTIKDGKATYGEQVVVDMEKQIFNIKVDEEAAE
ncbi:hypothetical protein A6779_09385 [Marinobacter adhaerens]|uniref:hypothetical protein n=1 Tax=Marinobacter adhaerens TaxID=1033846 RepID=UPI000840C6B0|nr:hypothetical protein [Marinobacter adhaerens]ODM32327.1 hypothetical protein A6779_09385 [Marinobacter adhaerens]